MSPLAIYIAGRVSLLICVAGYVYSVFAGYSAIHCTANFVVCGLIAFCILDED